MGYLKVYMCVCIYIYEKHNLIKDLNYIIIILFYINVGELVIKWCFKYTIISWLIWPYLRTLKKICTPAFYEIHVTCYIKFKLL